MGDALTLDEVGVSPEEAAQVIYDLRRGPQPWELVSKVRRLLELPEALGDEDGEHYYAMGHVPARQFVLAVMLDIAATADAEDARRFFDGVEFEDVHHQWFRYDRLPEDDEHMVACEPDHDDAEPFTVLALTP